MLRNATSFGGKTVVITGAASGIGKALAHQFAASGARVALLDIDGRSLALATRELPAERVTTRICDVRDPDACEAAIHSVIETFGGIDVLVNNAGLSHHSRFADTQLDVVRRVMDVNFYGAVHCTRAALDSLVARRGMIVVLSSVAGFAPLVGRCGYAASKHALHGLFDSLRSELVDDGVGVLMVCPSFTRTAIDDNALRGDGGRYQRGAAKPSGSSPDVVARDIVRAAGKRRKQLVLSPVGKTSYWLWHLLPPVYERLMRRSQRQELRQ